MLAYRADKAARCDTVTVTGNITPETFVAARDCLVQSSATKKTFVITTSAGGNGEAALALGILIHRYNWDVEVVDYCASSCANFIFPAGRVKYLHSNSMLLFHGGPHQPNMLEMALEADQARATTDDANIQSRKFGQADREGNIQFEVASDATVKVREFLSIEKHSTLVALIHKLRNLSDALYQELGVNPLLPQYGQMGDYESTYKSYKYIGFMYRLDSLHRLGVSNIELKDGEWHPEGHPVYEKVYEVTYP